DPTMDKSKYNIIYVNRSIRQDGVVQASLASPGTGFSNTVDMHGSGDLGKNLKFLLKFSDVYVCKSGASCLAQLFQLHDSSMIDLKPTIVLIDTPHDERIPESRPRTRSTSPHSRSPLADSEIHTPDEEVYGLKLLQRVITEAHFRNLAKLVVPVPVISVSPVGNGITDLPNYGEMPDSCGLIPNPALLKRCVDLGAADVVVSPLDAKCLTNLAVQAYKAHKEAARDQQAMLEVRRGRKLSWVGMRDEKPFAYLREAMVSGLMKGICRSGCDADDTIGSAKIAVSQERRLAIAAAVGHWHFSAHDFVDDELLVAAMIMFKHAFSVPALDKWRIPTDQLINFLVACRAAYNPFVPYHNFRHVVDVLQATFHFLVNIGTFPPYLTDSSILSTDMGLHFDYMKKLADTQEKLRVANSTTEWDERAIEEQRSLACALLIKCADISNVARQYGTARQWMQILSDEFSRQASMEDELGIPSALLSPPKKDTASLIKAQLGFMKLFALPLFQGVTDLMPALNYTLEELETNRKHFESGAVADHGNGVSHTAEVPTSSVSSESSAMGYPMASDSDVDGCSPETTILTSPPLAAPITPVTPLDNRQPNDVSCFSTPEHLTDVTQEAVDPMSKDFKDINGIATTFDSVADFAASDPFNMRYRLDSYSEGKPPLSGKQRCSETTDGSSSVPYSGDWTSQATSATTGRMPLSPSTQGTSIASRESIDRPSSVPRPVSGVAYDQGKLRPPLLVTPDPDLQPEAIVTDSSRDEDSASNGSTGKPESTTLRKRPSRFRMNALNLFRRNKTPTSAQVAAAAADTNLC
ncbi:hypothetical protein jhhlp_000289, partial [Lomentospora prolificans]